ncbi:MAG: DNA/RNA non-specific endonuclease [Desulfuromonadaceae bacterium]|nr:DNA/RNA non-specific endonuclease [Desulfuromonadaceae bacterium]
MNYRTFTPITLSFLLCASIALAAQTNCPEDFANGQAPDIINQKLSIKTRDVCYSGFALKHSGVTRTPLYSAEHLTRARLTLATGMKRSSKFHPDPNIPASERAELRDYARSGYDRGHVAPSGDMPDQLSQQECFTLANMLPEEPSVNRGIWERIESTTRKLAKTRGNLYIITGPIYAGSNIQRIGGAVLVPTQLFKAIYDPHRQEAGAYLVDNAEGAQVQIISIQQLESLSGISLFPSISDQVKKAGMRLPAPKERKRRGGALSEKRRI